MTPVHRVHMNYLTESSFAFVDPTSHIGNGTTIWHFATVLQEARIGERCSIGAHAEIGRGCVIGSESRIGSQVFLPPNTVIGERVFVGPGVKMADDRHPRIRRPGDSPYHAEPPVIEDDAVIGLGAVLLPGVRIGARAVVAAGAIVAQDVPPGGFVKCDRAHAFEPSAATLGHYTRELDDLPFEAPSI